MITDITHPLSSQAQQVASKRYFRKDVGGNCVENWSELSWRVVNHVCSNETEDFRRKLHYLFTNTYVLPNSPCLVNAGTSVGGLLACFVTKAPEDCWHDPNDVGMIENIANFGHIARRGGGCGMSLSKIRPEGDPVFGSTHAKACGPIEHLRMISEVMSSITQAGFRSMACMATLKVDHPDILNFIVCKQRDRALKTYLKDDFFNHYEVLKGKTHEHLNIILDKFIHNFNISVVVNNTFMTKVEKDENIDLVFNNKVYKSVKARDIFNAIAENAWKNGDPGILFYEAMNSGPYKYSKQEIVATNPCGEQQLPSYGSCNLGSIDVSKFYDPQMKDVDWAALKEVIHIMVTFLDDVIDVNKFPTEYFKKWAMDNRPVGLGIMGFADLLLEMKIAYGSKRSYEFATKLISFFRKEAHRRSVELGKERGTPKACQFKELDFRRNVTTLSIAPTGTISGLAGCSSSIEPIYSPVIERYDNTGNYTFAHPDADKSYFRYAVAPHNCPQEYKDKELKPEQHIEMQAIFQAHVDSGISKTINLPNSATIEDIKKSYMLAWKGGCKGITVYRDGSKTMQVLNTQKKRRFGAADALNRPEEVPADIHKASADGYEWHMIIGKVDNEPYELFAVNGKQTLPDKGFVVKRKRRHYSLLDENRNVLIDNIAEVEHDIDPRISLETRRFSLELRHCIPPKYIVDQIDKSTATLTSFSKAAGRIIKKYLTTDDLISIAQPCPECAKKGKNVKMTPGATCWQCPECLHSLCG